MMKAFEDDVTAATIGDFNIENGMKSISLHGSLDIEKTKGGLEKAKKLLVYLQDIVDTLEESDLIEDVSPSPDIQTVANPFKSKD